MSAKIRRRRFRGQPTKRITAEVLVTTYQKLIADGKSLGWAIDDLAKYATSPQGPKNP